MRIDMQEVISGYFVRQEVHKHSFDVSAVNHRASRRSVAALVAAAILPGPTDRPILTPTPDSRVILAPRATVD